MSSRTRGAVASGAGHGVPRGLHGLAPALAPALAATVLLTACGPVELATPDLAEADAAACAALVADLPATLAGQDRVETEPAGAPGAAWGDPPIVLSCGAGEPADFEPDSACLNVSGVDWFVLPEQDLDNDADLALTTVGLEPRVRLDVPAEERPDGSAAALAELAAVLQEHLRPAQPCL